MKKVKSEANDWLSPEYKRSDLGRIVRGKYYKRVLKGANVVVLEPDIAKAFPNSVSVNDVLRVVLKAGQAARRLTTRKTRTRAKTVRVS